MWVTLRVRGARIACALALALIAFAASTASGQVSDRGRITGRVTDATGGVLPGVRLTLTADEVNRSVVTDTDGSYAFDGLVPDVAHTIQAELAGFMTARFAGLLVTEGETTRVDLSLKLSSCLERGPPLYGIPPPLDQLLAAEAVAHVRIAEGSYKAQIGGVDSDCPLYTHHATATILQVSTSSRGAWRSGTTIDVYYDHSLTAGSEYVAFLEYDDIAGRYKIGEPYIAMSVNG